VTTINEVVKLRKRILDEISKVIIGKDDIKEALILALITGGHILIEGQAGSAKTKLASTFSRVVGGTFKRIQLTPDLMPADITGFYLYSPSGNPQLIKGPIFANVVVADELNRTTPRTQAALLEAMQEQQVTIERETFTLEKPFMVIATQLKAGSEGTYPLTDVQVDRFLLRIWSNHPSSEEEQNVLANIDKIDIPKVQPVTNAEEIIGIQELAKTIHVSPLINQYIVALINHLRNNPEIQNGPSTRGSIALYKCARVLAMLDGRNFVIPDDVQHLIYLALEHRIQLRPEAELDNITLKILLERAIEQIPVPKNI
jgi:MoxR-like ATPase